VFLLEVMLNRELLGAVATGQQQRNISDISIRGYLSKMHVLTRKLNEIEDLRLDALEFDNDGNPKRHLNAARNVIRLRLPMEVETGRLLFAALSIDGSLKRRQRGAIEINEAEAQQLPEDLRNLGANISTVSAQTYQNYKSALKWWHEYTNADFDKVGITFPPEVDKAINTQILTYKRDVASKKRRGIMSHKEGKSPYSLQGYVEICTYFMKMKPISIRYTWMEGLFAQLFTKLSVNTIGRSDNIDDLLLEHIGVENDHITVLFCTTKSDQTGEKTSEVKRLFANPHMPEICVMFGLAIYTWCKRRVPGDRQLFDGKDQNKRYYNILINAVENIPDHVNLGCSRKDIGTHSNRKFAESTSVSRVVGPSRTQVCLRAGQSVGRSQDCYMFTEDDGDSLVGRTVAQLKFDADQFDILPCHFGRETLAELHAYGWENILDGYDNLPASFRRLVPLLLASLVYHYSNGDMERLLPKDHPIWMQPIFTDRALIESLRSKVIFVFSYCSDTMMHAQGVPGFITISREIRNFKAHYDSMSQQYRDSVNLLSTELNHRFAELPQVIVNVLLEQVRVDGAHPITLDSIRRLISEMLVVDGGPLAQIRDSIQQLSQRLSTQQTLTAPSNVNNGNPLNNDAITGTIHLWPNSDGRLHRVPFGFKWPSYNTSTIWNLWHFGDGSRGIGPYKVISRAHDLTTTLCKTNYSRTRMVINALVAFAIRDRMITTASDINRNNSQHVFDHVMPLLIEELYPELHERPIDLNINTLGNRMQKNHQTGRN
jgi:hypothetical protein